MPPLPYARIHSADQSDRGYLRVSESSWIDLLTRKLRASDQSWSSLYPRPRLSDLLCDEASHDKINYSVL
jgi:hypothetical protein